MAEVELRAVVVLTAKAKLEEMAWLVPSIAVQFL